MNMKTIMSVLLKNSTFVACVSLCSTFAHKLCGSVIVEAVQGAFPVPREGETNAASGIIFTGARGCTPYSFKCTADTCCSPRKCICGRCYDVNNPRYPPGEDCPNPNHDDQHTDDVLPPHTDDALPPPPITDDAIELEQLD